MHVSSLIWAVSFASASSLFKVHGWLCMTYSELGLSSQQTKKKTQKKRKEKRHKEKKMSKVSVAAPLTCSVVFIPFPLWWQQWDVYLIA